MRPPLGLSLARGARVVSRAFDEALGIKPIELPELGIVGRETGEVEALHSRMEHPAVRDKLGDGADA